MSVHALTLLASGSDDLMEHVLPHYFGLEPGQPSPAFGFSNHIFMMIVAASLMLIIFLYVGGASKKTLVPTGVHNFFESILSFLRTEVVRPALGDNTDRFVPFIWTVFFFVLFCNVLGLIPVNDIVGLITGKEAHFWGTATANFSITGGLAVLAFVTVHCSGIIQAVRVKMDPSLAPHHQGTDHAPPHGHGEMLGSQGIEDERDVVLDHRVGDGHDHAHGMHSSKQFQGQPFFLAIFTGIGTYIWNFAPHPEIGWKVLDIGMWCALLVLELFGSLVKPMSLCVRLFANMLAGHLVLAALIGMIPFGASLLAVGGASAVVIAGCAALSMLELFVAFLQAYIFTFLTTLYIASAIAPEH
jgi:F0F1-type ATP synthase membrane subunit a